MGDDPTLDERTIARLERRVAALEVQLMKLRDALAPFAKGAFLPPDFAVPPGLPFTRADCEHAVLMLAGAA